MSRRPHNTSILVQICESDAFVELAHVLGIYYIITLRRVSRAMRTALEVHLKGMTVRGIHVIDGQKYPVVEVVTTIPNLNKRLVHDARYVHPKGQHAYLVTESADSVNTIYSSQLYWTSRILVGHIYIYAVNGVTRHALIHVSNDHTMTPRWQSSTVLYKSTSPITVGAMIGRFTMSVDSYIMPTVTVHSGGLVKDIPTSEYITTHYAKGSYIFVGLAFLQFIVGT